MKQFFKNVAATIVGIFGFGIIMVILAVITLIGMICNSSKTPSLKDNSVMVMKLQGQISDQATTTGWDSSPVTNITTLA